MKSRCDQLKSLTRLGIAIATLIAGPVFGESPQTTTLARSEGMVDRCLRYAAHHRLTPLSVAVVDLSGNLITFKRQDGAATVTAEAALLKARTAVRVNAPTAVLAHATADDDGVRDALLLMGLTTLPGGAPFSEAGQVIGAIGVSGALPEHDAECARLAVEPLEQQDN